VPELWLRLRPGTKVNTHAYTQTGQALSKFGMGAAEIITAVNLCISRQIPLKGLHFHLGSHFHDPEPLRAAIEIALRLLAEIRRRSWLVSADSEHRRGWGIAYHEDDLPHPSIENYMSVHL